MTIVGPVAPDRLRDGRTIGAVLRGRRKRAGRLLVMHVQDRRDEAATRIAVVASKRVGGAVQRNRAKRLLREAARHQSWVVGLDVVLVARAACVAAELVHVEHDLAAAMTSLQARGPDRVERGTVVVGAGSAR